MLTRRLIVLAVLGLTGLVAYAANHNDWGRPLGEGYSGPEVRPRLVATSPIGLGEDEQRTIRVFEQATRAVVFISNTGIQRDPWSLNVFEVPQGAGTGFVWNRKGHIVTNFHVVYHADAIGVTLANRKEYSARVVGVDPDHDLAVLQIKAPPTALFPVHIGSSHTLRVGQKVLAIGNPFGLDHTLTTGVVSALGRTIKSLTNRTIEGVIQTDAAINPGNSGGPLLDSLGRLIGINTQIVSPSGAFAGIGFAVPVNMVNRIVPDLIQYGKLIRPGLGISLVTDLVAQGAGVEGVMIRKVYPGSAAKHAGLKGIRETMFGRVEFGDIITSLGGNPVTTTDDLLNILNHHKVGDQVELRYLRDGRTRVVRVRLEAIN